MKKLKSFCIVSGLKIGAVALFFGFLSGCACHEYVAEPDWRTRALRRNPLSTFIDSSNNYLQILVIDTTYDTKPADPMTDNHRDDCLDYYPRTIGMYYPNIPGRNVRYSQANGSNISNLELLLTGYYFPIVKTLDTTLTLQGFDFLNCYYSQQRDSLGVIQELGFSAEYGIVLFAYRDQYRWERVLNP